MSEYMKVLVLSGALPLVLSFWPGLKFYSYLRSLSLSIFLVLFVFGAWDVAAVMRGHWQFDPSGVWPMRVFNLPLEEVLFFVVVPFCCIFTWETLKFLKIIRR